MGFGFGIPTPQISYTNLNLNLKKLCFGIQLPPSSKAPKVSRGIAASIYKIEPNYTYINVNITQYSTRFQGRARIL